MKHFSARLLHLTLIWFTIYLTACDGSTVEAILTPTLPEPVATGTILPAENPDETSSGTATVLSEPGTAEIAATTAVATEVAFTPVVATSTSASPPVYTYEIVATYKHDPTAFTQGLVIEGDTLYEGTGLRGESTLREVVLETGEVLRMHELEDHFFGEGITLLDDKIYQVTWQEQTGFVYDRATFEPLQTFAYSHEGWGITHDGERLIVSDGTPTIYFWDPATLQEIGHITVRDDEGTLHNLNELEYVNGEIWANIWLTDLIARISPETGDVLGYIDLTGLLDTSAVTQPVDVLNGIAYDPAADRLFVTGKLWPSLFEIKIVPAP
jgi:glutamine cyclotransferase